MCGIVAQTTSCEHFPYQACVGTAISIFIGHQNRITGIRKQLSRDLGFVLPQVRIRDSLDMAAQDYAVLMGGVSIARGNVRPGKLLAIDAGDVRPGHGLTGEPTREVYAALKDSLGSRDVVANSPLPLPTKIEAKVETPTVELPKVELPKMGLQKNSTAKAEAPKAEAPKVEPAKVEMPKAVEVPKAEAPKAEIAVPKPAKPKPKPQPPKPVEKKPEPPKEKPSEEKPADTQPTQAPTEKSAQPAPGPSPAQMAAKASWQGTLLAHLAKYKKYPASAQARGKEGLNRLKFVVDAEGMVLGRLATEIARIINTEEVGDVMRGFGLRPVGNDRKTFSQTVDNDLKVWTSVIGQTGIKIE